MDKEFVPYAESLALKQLGFDEECFDYYIPNRNNDPISNIIGYELGKHNSNKNTIYNSGITSRPLYQQVFRWFLKEHYLYAVIIPTITMCWTFKIIISVDTMVEVPPYSGVDGTDYTTREEVELVCIRKLIEIVEKISSPIS